MSAVLALLPHLAGALDVSQLRAYRAACIRARAGSFPRDYPTPEAIEAILDVVLDVIRRTEESDYPGPVITDAMELGTLIDAAIDCNKERDREETDCLAAQKERDEMEEKLEKAEEDIRDARAESAVWEGRAREMARTVNAMTLVWPEEPST